MANTYDIGDLVRVSAAFATSGGVATDPTTVTLKVQSPAGTETTYTYALTEVTKGSVGNYYKDLTITLPGRWVYRWIGTGAVVAASEAHFLIRRSEFA
jgi:hypothetical protein